MKNSESSRKPFQDIISRLPFPVAFRCRFVLTQENRRSATESILDAYESLLKFLALVAVSDYLRGVLEARAIDEKLKTLFGRKISPGHWVEILREILRVYSNSPEKVFMPELLRFYYAGKRLSGEARSFEDWVNRRNTFRGHAKRLITEDFVRKTWKVWWPEFQQLISSVEFLTSYELIIPAFIQRGIIKKAQLCTGPDQLFLYNDHYDLTMSIKGVEPEESLILVNKNAPQRQLLLYPFIVVKAPANLYLFEQGEKRRGNLQKVVFASLGPGDALEIRRVDEGNRVISDLEKKLQRLGEIGISLDGIPIEALAGRSESPVLEEAERTAAGWAEEGYPYYVVEGISEKLKALIRHPPKDIEIEEDNVLAFMMVAALHYGGNWNCWVEKNRKNAEVVMLLLETLSISYARPRFRALFALQSLDAENIKKGLEVNKALVPPDIIKLVRKYVLTGKVSDYLTKIKDGPDSVLGKKAAAVLREIRQFTDPNNESGGSWGLPVV